jgi:two-component system, NtrC family, nitrogen regulation sensor histidine kinase NtrY
MDTTNKTNYKVLIFFLLTFLLGIFTFFYSKLIIQKSNEQVTERVQSVLFDKEIKLNEVLNEARDSLATGSDDLHLLFNKISKESRNNGFYIFVYQDSELKYWSDNSVIISESVLSDDFETGFSFISNGWYLVKKFTSENYLLAGLIKIKNKYLYENDFLRNEFLNDFGIVPEIDISTKKSEFNIFDLHGQYLFSFQFPTEFKISESKMIILTILCLTIYLLLLITIFYGYQSLSQYNLKKWILFSGFIIDIMLLRFIIYYFEIPHILYKSHLFSPAIYASSVVNPSLGDFLFNSISLLAISYFIQQSFRLSTFNALKNKYNKYFFTGSIFVGVYILLVILDSQFISLILNSKLSFDMYDITTIDKYSIIGLLCFGVLILSFVLLSYEPLLFTAKLFERSRQYNSILLIVLIPSIILCRLLFHCSLLLLIFFILYIVSFRFANYKLQSNFKISFGVLILILFSLYSTFVVYNTNSTIEKEGRTIIAQKLANERDYSTEYQYNNTVSRIHSDTIISDLIKINSFQEKYLADSLMIYLRQNYFSGLWNKYDLLFTVCDSTKTLEIQPESYMVNCDDYFHNLIETNGDTTDVNNLFFMRSDFVTGNYLGIIEFPSKNSTLRIYIEIYSKSIPRGLGYPELLNDQKSEFTSMLTKYSWARYENKDLVYHFGKFSYAINLANYPYDESTKRFFDLNRFNHLFFPVDSNTTLILSKKNPGLINIAAPFSYFFIFYGLLFLICLMLNKGVAFFYIPDISIKRRLQLFITTLIIVSFLFVGVSSLFYIASLNNNKNRDLLSEKAHSVLIELEHKLAGEEKLTPEIQQYLSDLLYKFSMVFFSDINLYDPDGTLLATSRPEIFNKGLISIKMNPEAFVQMSYNQNSFYLHEESIGDYGYLSAYLPFRNEQNKLIAYLNLPYFAKQEELTNDISTYLVALINIYVILIALSILIALIVSRYVTRPVEMIKNKISRLKLGNVNDKIEWDKNDEIGGLVTEYNRMVDELTKSADLLAKSERESAWREMAKQIAHEIKNPLTPMKLSVQYLQKAWDEKAPEFDQRLKRFSQTIIDQIESLSKIASEFSDFAKMPKTNYEKINLNSVIDHSVSLFRFSTQVRFHNEFSGDHFVKADKEQLQRVFINLINNSIQAISNPEKGIIKISLETEAGNHLIRFSDNGKGIPKEQRSRVFYPNFTTKSGGTGLGLAMVKNIIQNSHGEITFESEEGRGTSFIIMLPVYDE